MAARIALCVPRRYMQRNAFCAARAASPTEKTMRAEIERLVEEIKQSVGLLRRHL
jgi:hypothetical protein